MHRGEVRRHLGAVTPVSRQADAPLPGKMEAELRPSQLSRHASRARFICLAARSPPFVGPKERGSEPSGGADGGPRGWSPRQLGRLGAGGAVRCFRGSVSDGGGEGCEAARLQRPPAGPSGSAITPREMRDHPENVCRPQTDGLKKSLSATDFPCRPTRHLTGPAFGGVKSWSAVGPVPSAAVESTVPRLGHDGHVTGSGQDVPRHGG